MSSILWPIFVLIFFASAAVAALWGYRAYTTGDTSLSLAWLFPPRPEPRLAVMEQASVDSKRKLVLIRRDDVEHLIMTGGPVDVVIETGIASAPREVVERDLDAAARPERVEPAAPVFTRAPRTFGQAVNE
jgi:flagellar protein FliO/FliZ